jgi:2-iminoacetate synthase
VALAEGVHGGGATEQFAIADVRSPAEVALALQRVGLEAVWKDWDPAIMGGGLP